MGCGLFGSDNTQAHQEVQVLKVKQLTMLHCQLARLYLGLLQSCDCSRHHLLLVVAHHAKHTSEDIAM